MPLPTSARLYTGQLRTRYLKMKSDLPISRFYGDEAAPEGGLCNNASLNSYFTIHRGGTNSAQVAMDEQARLVGTRAVIIENSHPFF